MSAQKPLVKIWWLAVLTAALLFLAADSAQESARLARCWATFQPPDIRRPAPETLVGLLQLTRDFKVVPPPELLALAESLAAADRPH